MEKAEAVLRQNIDPSWVWWREDAFTTSAVITAIPEDLFTAFIKTAKERTILKTNYVDSE